MGWTSYHATHYTKGGKIDRKTECDNLINYEEDGRSCKVLKSAMNGSTYYAAVEFINKYTGMHEVFAVVFLTRIAMRDYYNFWYKDMKETYGPCECDCPKGILDLLTETDSEWANEWRKRCRERLEEKKNKQNLGKLPVGTIIEIVFNGKTQRVIKRAPNNQFKTPWWYNPATNRYISKKWIKEFKVVENLI